MKLSIVKVLSFFILLLAGNTSYAFTLPQDTEDIDKVGITHDISEDIQDVSPSTLTGPNNFDTLRLHSHSSGDFYFQSTYVARNAVRYIAFSRSIDPGLTVSDIIFPFHFFT